MNIRYALDDRLRLEQIENADKAKLLDKVVKFCKLRKSNLVAKEILEMVEGSEDDT